MHSWWGRRYRNAVEWLAVGEEHGRNSSWDAVRLRGKHSVRRGSTSHKAGSSMPGRGGAAHLVGRTGLGAANCSRIAAAVGAVEHEQGQLWGFGSDAMPCGLVRRGWVWGRRREGSRTYPTVETVGLRRGRIAIARLGRRGVAVVIRLRRTGAQGDAVVSGEIVKERVSSDQPRGGRGPGRGPGRDSCGSHTGSSPGTREMLLAGARRRTRFGSRDSQT